MDRRQWTSLSFNIIVILVAALLGVAQNLAADQADSALNQVIQKGALPIMGALVLLLILGHIVIYRMEHPPAPRRQWDATQIPYPGLEAFTETEASVFFGRDDQANELIKRLHAGHDEAFVVVVGASGSGKSSLVHAGLLPRLRSRKWIILPTVSPKTDPVGSLATALADEGLDLRHTVSKLRNDSSSLAQLITQVRQQKGRRLGRVLLMIDQMEELFTLSGGHDREAFLTLIAEALAADRRLWVVGTARIEFLRNFLETSHASLFGHPLALGAITRADLRMVIEEPAALAEMKFAPGLVAKIVEDTGTSDALPLLAYLLQELYFAVGPGRIVTVEDYVRLGGVSGALARQADQVLLDLRGEEDMSTILNVLFRFVTTDGAQVTRRIVPLAPLSTAERRVVDSFVDARLLVTDLTNGSAVAQVAHEALFRQWPPLRQEVEARSEQLRQRAELERWTMDWQHSGRKFDYLLTGERLQLALQWVDHIGEHLPEVVHEFINQSKSRDLAYLRSVSESVAEYVLANVEKHPDLAVILALAALSECPPTGHAVRALFASLAFNHLADVMVGHNDSLWRLAWSPDGRRIATTSVDSTARIWDTTTGSCGAVLGGHTRTVESVAWAPDSTHLATASRDGIIRIWTTEGALASTLSQPNDVIRAVQWSPDGRQIACGADQTVRVWDVARGEIDREFTGHRDHVFAVAFSPDGSRLASCSHDRTIRIWDFATGEALVLEGHQDLVEGISWSPDGSRIASASSDQSARIWDVASGRQVLLIRGHSDSVWGVQWSPHGDRLATCGADRTARIWNPENAAEIVALHGHSGDVFDICWSPDGAQVATASDDGSLRTWTVNPRGAEQVLLTGHAAPVRRALFLPPLADDQRELAVTCSDDQTVRVWDIATGESVHVLHEHQDAVMGMAVADGMVLTCSKDRTARIWHGLESNPEIRHVLPCTDGIAEAVALSGDVAAVAGRDNVIRLWSTVDGTQTQVLSGHKDWVVDIAWSRSGRFLASASDDRTARIWDVATHQDIRILSGHESWVDSVAWSPDDRFVVTGSADRTLRVWNVATGEQVAVMSGHQDRVHAVSWSPDGAHIATASHDSTIRLWDAHTHTEVGVIGVHRDKATSVAWSPDSSCVISGSYDGTARVWKSRVDLDELKARARTRAFRSLTEQERRSHLLPATGEA
ncbi:WD40 repeat domain-containing protein [Nonomuraea sp. NPDC005650]|uniref:WD40 repeat domain-containing protein n=1 Tax=Nonomuraea sp. NPDC005650 TaxID=3157045 RepID=UPI0033BE4744